MQPSCRRPSHPSTQCGADRLLAQPQSGVHELANRIALSCDCMVLAPAGLVVGTPPFRLAEEAWAAATFLNREHGVQALVVLAEGPLVPPVVELVTSGDMPAHALGVLGGADGATDPALLRDIGVPFLALLPAEGGGAERAHRMRDARAACAEG